MILIDHLKILILILIYSLLRLQTENFTNQLAKETNKQLKDLNTFVRLNASMSPSSEDVSKEHQNDNENCAS